MTHRATSSILGHMLKIRLARIGRKNDPSYRVVVTEHTRGPKSGNHIEVLGNYNPKVDNVTLDGERIKYWISNGAQVSDTVHNILINQGVIKGKKINVLPKKSPIVKESEEGAEAEVSAEAPEVSAEVPSKDDATDSETPTEDVKEEAPAEETPVAEEEPEEVASVEESKEETPTEEAPAEEEKKA